ncbi:hypothetical protein F5X96DRAFT_503396 [Biscogniauxia mediterranea]|nr:hypothetical protein F5X96DRAFT_503396 [Biscogniauxia mediterranea]
MEGIHLLAIVMSLYMRGGEGAGETAKSSTIHRRQRYRHSHIVSYLGPIIIHIDTRTYTLEPLTGQISHYHAIWGASYSSSPCIWVAPPCRFLLPTYLPTTINLHLPQTILPPFYFILPDHSPLEKTFQCINFFFPDDVRFPENHDFIILTYICIAAGR